MVLGTEIKDTLVPFLHVCSLYFSLLHPQIFPMPFTEMCLEVYFLLFMRSFKYSKILRL